MNHQLDDFGPVQAVGPRGKVHLNRTNQLSFNERRYQNAAAVLDCRKDVHRRAVEQVSGEEVQRQDALRLGSQELRPARAVPARSRVDPGVLEDLPHRGRRHDDAEPGKLAVDPAVSP